MSIINYIIRRLFLMIFVLFGVLTLTFFLSRLLPGDPVLSILSLEDISKPDPDVYLAMKKQLGLDQPIIVQYFKYLIDLFSGNWGVSISISRNEPVWDLIMERLPRTIDLTVFSMIIASIVGIKIGTISATHRNKVRDMALRGFSLIGVSIPVFFTGLLLQYVFAYKLQIFPATGYKNMRYEDPPIVTGFYIIDAVFSGQLHKVWDYLYHLFLPVICISFIMIAGIARQVRSSMLDVLEQDYIRTAFSKGVKKKYVIKHHALKNAMIPTTTVIGLNVAGLLTGAVLTESTFSIVGMGTLMIHAIETVDYWLLNACVFLITIFYLIVNLITDIIYGYLDPRIRLNKRR